MHRKMKRLYKIWFNTKNCFFADIIVQIKIHFFQVFKHSFHETAIIFLKFSDVLAIYLTAWKVSLLGVFLVHTFLHTDWIQYLSGFCPNAGKCGPEKLRIHKLFTQCLYCITKQMTGKLLMPANSFQQVLKELMME